MNEKQSDDYSQSMLQLMMERETEYSVDDPGLNVRLDPKTGRTQYAFQNPSSNAS
jgi:hypothetical protein